MFTDIVKILRRLYCVSNIIFWCDANKYVVYYNRIDKNENVGEIYMIKNILLLVCNLTFI